MLAVETADPAGRFTLELIAPDGTVAKRILVPNLLVTTGKEAIADRVFAGGSAGAPKFIAVGSGATAAAEGQTALVTELKRKEATGSRTGKVLTLSVEFPAGEALEVKELGTFTANAGGTMYSRAVTETLAKPAEYGLLVTWTLTIN